MRSTPYLMLATLSFPLTILGCAKEAPPPEVPVVELSTFRCPPIDDGARNAILHRVPRPKGAVSKADVRRWVDSLEVDAERKIEAGMLIMREYDDCRDGGSGEPAS
jgi:hypothetical protein